MGMMLRISSSIAIVSFLTACSIPVSDNSYENTNSITTKTDSNIQYALESVESGKYHYWKSGNVEGRIRPLNTSQTHAGVYCREYISETRQNGAVISSNGLLCRDNNLDRWVSRSTS